MATADETKPAVPTGAYEPVALHSAADAAVFAVTDTYWARLPPDVFATAGCPAVIEVLKAPPALVLLVTTTPP